MSTVAGWAEAGWVVMAADSASVGEVGGNDKRIWTGYRKIVRVGAAAGRRGKDSALIASCGNAALTPLARWAAAIPPPPMSTDDDNLHDQWAWKVACELEARAKKAGIVQVEDDVTRVDGGWLLGCHGRLWHLADHLAERTGPYDAIGSGSDYAIGALDVLSLAVRRGELTPTEALERAVEVACRHDSGSRPPIAVEAVSGPR